jgi:hypothetical protein
MFVYCSYKNYSDTYNKAQQKLADPKFIESNIFKYGISKLSLPESLKTEVYFRMVAQLDASEFIHDNRNDIHSTIMKTCSKFMEFFIGGHRISSNAAYFIKIFKTDLQRKRLIRYAS